MITSKTALMIYASLAIAMFLAIPIIFISAGPACGLIIGLYSGTIGYLMMRDQDK